MAQNVDNLAQIASASWITRSLAARNVLVEYDELGMSVLSINLSWEHFVQKYKSRATLTQECKKRVGMTFEMLHSSYLLGFLYLMIQIRL